MPPVVAYILSHHLPPLFDGSHRSPLVGIYAPRLPMFVGKAPDQWSVLDVRLPLRSSDWCNRS